MFTIEDAKRVQQDLGLRDVHVVYFDLDEGWVMAHTDAERAEAARNVLAPLTSCWAHLWLSLEKSPGAREFFPDTGWYEISDLFEVKGLAL